MAERGIGVQVCWVEKAEEAEEAGGTGGAAAERVRRLALELPAGSTIGELLARVELAALAPRVHAGELALAVYGREAGSETVLNDGDRVELLAGLRVDPKLARAARARRKAR